MSSASLTRGKLLEEARGQPVRRPSWAPSGRDIAGTQRSQTAPDTAPLLGRFPGIVAMVICLAAVTTGCAAQVNMANAYEPGRAATTIPYSGVRGARQFPDYQPIGKSILTGKDPQKSDAFSGKSSKKRGGKR